MARTWLVLRAAPILLTGACSTGWMEGAEQASGTGRAERALTAEEECPLDDVVARPAAVLVRVLDVDGAPLQGASVVLDGRGVETDEQGDAAFFRLPPGELPLRVDAPGLLPLTRPVTVEEGEQVRLRVTAQSSPDPVDFVALAGLVATAPSAQLTVLPDAVETIMGGAPPGPATARWMTRDADALLAARVGEDATQRRVVLSPVGGLSFSLSSPGGEPLVLGGGLPAIFSQIVADPGCEDACDGILAWRLDAWSGLWVEQTDVHVEPTPTPSGLWIRAELPQPGDWLFASAAEPGCVTVSFDGCDGAEDLPLAVRATWSGGDETRARSTANPSLRLSDLPRGEEITLTLEGGHTALDAVSVTVADSDDCAEVTLSTPECGLALGLASPSACPATLGAVRVTSADGAEVYEQDAAGLVRFPDLGEGYWRVEVLDEAGAVRASDSLFVTDDELRYALVEVQGLEDAAPAGGCAPAPCSGATCDACALYTVIGEAGLPVPGESVSAYDPASAVGTTESGGEVCFDAPAGVGVDLVSYVPGVEPTRLTLTGPGLCLDESTCGAVTLYTAASCSATETPLALSTRVLGWADPGRQGAALDASAWSLSGTSFRLTSPATGSLPDLSCVGGVWSALELESDTLGVVWSADTRIVCDTTDGLRAELELVWPERALGLGTLPVSPEGAGDGDTLSLRLTVWSDSGDELGRWSSGEGALELYSRGPSRLLARGGAALTDEDGFSTDVELAFDAAIMSASSVPRGRAQIQTVPAPGAAVRAAAPMAGWERAVVPLTESRSALGGGAGEPDRERFPPALHCLPRDTPITISGLGALDDLVEPFALMVQAQPTGVKNYRNAAPDAPLLVPSTLYYMTRDLAETLYRNNGVPVSEIDAGATLLGRPARVDASTHQLVTLHGFGSAVLRGPSGRTYRAVPLDNDLRPTTADRAELFVFLGVAPTTEDAPYVLTLKDRGGVVVSEYTQRFAPVAGGVAVLAWEEERSP